MRNLITKLPWILLTSTRYSQTDMSVSTSEISCRNKTTHRSLTELRITIQRQPICMTLLIPKDTDIKDSHRKQTSPLVATSIHQVMDLVQLSSRTIKPLAQSSNQVKEITNMNTSCWMSQREVLSSVLTPFSINILKRN